MLKCFMDIVVQVFVETLDRCFENVCELDLIFHSDKVPQWLVGSPVASVRNGFIRNALS